MKIIDAHLHLAFGYSGFNELAQNAGHENSLAYVQKLYDELNICHGVVMSNGGLQTENHVYPPTFSYCIGLDARMLSEYEPEQALYLIEENLKKDACVGVKLYPGYSDVLVSDPFYDPIYELAIRYGKVVAMHTGALAGSHRGRLKNSHPLHIDDAAGKFPDCKIVMCHLGNPFLAEAAAVVEKNPNVYADLSGFLVGQCDMNEYFMRMGGYVNIVKSWIAYVEDYSRFMFGTDWPLANYQNCIDFVKEIIPEKHHEAVFYENAKRIYGLSGI